MFEYIPDTKCNLCCLGGLSNHKLKAYKVNVPSITKHKTTTDQLRYDLICCFSCFEHYKCLSYKKHYLGPQKALTKGV